MGGIEFIINKARQNQFWLLGVLLESVSLSHGLKYADDVSGLPALFRWYEVPY